MADVTDKQIVSAIKKVGNKSDGTYSEAAVAAELGVKPAQLGGRHFRLEVEAFPNLAFKERGKALEKAIVKARESGVRWERLAARSGMSIPDTKAAYESASGKKWTDSYSGRGRNFTGQARKSSASATSGRRGGAKQSSTSGRRGAAGGRGQTRGQTRGQRRGAKASDPS